MLEKTSGSLSVSQGREAPMEADERLVPFRMPCLFMMASPVAVLWFE